MRAGPTLLAVLGRKISTCATPGAAEKPLAGSTATPSNSSVGHNREARQRHGGREHGTVKRNPEDETGGADNAGILSATNQSRLRNH